MRVTRLTADQERTVHLPGECTGGDQFAATNSCSTHVQRREVGASDYAAHDVYDDHVERAVCRE